MPNENRFDAYRPFQNVYPSDTTMQYSLLNKIQYVHTTIIKVK